MKEHTLKIGVGSGSIRFPDVIFPTEGFCGVHDDPKIRIMVLKSNMSFAIVSCEMVMLPDQLIEQMRKRIEEIAAVPVENVWIHMTHTISTPHLPGMIPFPPSDDTPEMIETKQIAYCGAVFQAMEEAADKAARSLTAGRISVGRGVCNVNQNRDEETPFGWWVGSGSDGDSNKTMTVLRAEDMGGKSLGFLVSYGLKPCALDNSGMMSNTRQISSDVPGYACARLEERYGVPVLYCMAAAGDQIPRQVALYEKVNGEGKPEYVDLGVETGLNMVKSLGEEMAGDMVSVIETMERKEQSAELVKLETSFLWPCKPRSRMAPTKEPVYQADREEKVDAAVLCLGEIAFVACKPEVNTTTERQLWERSPFETTLLISMVNGGMKYMPEVSAYERCTWEAQSAALMPGAAEAFVDHVVELLSAVKEGAK